MFMRSCFFSRRRVSACSGRVSVANYKTSRPRRRESNSCSDRRASQAKNSRRIYYFVWFCLSRVAREFCELPPPLHRSSHYPPPARLLLLARRRLRLLASRLNFFSFLVLRSRPLCSALRCSARLSLETPGSPRAGSPVLYSRLIFNYGTSLHVTPPQFSAQAML